MLCMCKIIHPHQQEHKQTNTNRNTTNKLNNIKNKIKIETFKILLMTNYKLFFKLHIYLFMLDLTIKNL